MPRAVSGRRYTFIVPSAVEPISVANMGIDSCTSVQLRVPLMGSTISQSIISWRSPFPIFAIQGLCYTCVYLVAVCFRHSNTRCCGSKLCFIEVLAKAFPPLGHLFLFCRPVSVSTLRVARRLGNVF